MKRSSSTAPVPNPGYDRTVAILREAGYNRLRSFEAKHERGEIVPEIGFEVWGGRKGTFILQQWKGGNGAHLYGTQGLGYTFEDLKAIL